MHKICKQQLDVRLEFLGIGPSIGYSSTPVYYVLQAFTNGLKQFFATVREAGANTFLSLFWGEHIFCHFTTLCFTKLALDSPVAREGHKVF